VLPFIFIFNTQLLMIDIDNWFHLVIIIVGAVAAMLAFAAATQRFFLVKSRIWETVVLLLVAFTLFRPGFWWDEVFPPLEEKPVTNLAVTVGAMTPGEQLLLEVKGEDFKGKEYTKVLMLPVGSEAAGTERLNAIGIETRQEDGKTFVDNVGFSSPAEKAGIDFDQEILNIHVPTHRPPKELMFIPAAFLYALVWFVQRRRKRKLEAAAA